MKVWHLMLGGIGATILTLAFWAVVILGGIWAVTKLLRHLELIG